MSDDFLASTATTGVLPIGGSATGNIDFDHDHDWFKATLTAGHAYRFDLEGSDTGQGTLDDPFLALLDATGADIVSNDDTPTNLNSQITFIASASGTYYLAANSFGSATGTYRLSAVDLGPRSDDYKASTGTSGTLNIGGSVTGAIDFTQDHDWFRVTLTAGQQYRFDLGGSDAGQGTLADPRLTLVSDDDTVFGTTSGGVTEQITFVPSSTGVYFLNVQASAGVGTYTLKAVGLGPGSDDYPASTATTGAVSVGGSTTGSIDFADDRDFFRVTLTANHLYRFDLQGSDTGQGTLPDPLLVLRDSTGDGLASDDDAGIGSNAQIDFAASLSGTYFLDARASFGSGTYRLSATDLGPFVDDYPASTSTSGVVNVGGSATGDIQFTNDEDWFAVTLTAGQAYRFDLEGSPTGQGTNDDPFLVLRDASGEQIQSDDDSGTGFNSQISFVAAVSGTYFLDARSVSGPGTYRLSAALAPPPPPDDFPGSTATAGVVNVGGSVAGTVQFAGDHDWFRVTLAAGQEYRFDLEGLPTNNGTLDDPFLTVRDAAGKEVASDDDSGTGFNARITFVADVSGTYYLDAVGFSTAGSYTLSVTGLGAAIDDYTASPVAPGVLNVGTSATGAIQFTNDQDWFRVALHAGQGYRFDLEGSVTDRGTLDDPLLTLRDAAGHSIASDDDGGFGVNSRLTFVPSANGVYYADAGPFDGTGTYTLSAVPVVLTFQPEIDGGFFGDVGGDGRSDILIHSLNGGVALWQLNGGQVVNPAVIGGVGPEWTIEGTADFNGDARADALWRASDGTLMMWQMNGAQFQSAIAGRVGNEWSIAGTGDFNGDGRGDIAWMRNDGTLLMFQMNGSQLQSAPIFGQVGREWHVEGIGDFNGDGRSDFLLRSDAGRLDLDFMNGAQIQSSATIGAVGREWHIEGLADFNGDGKADILWKNDSGQLMIWRMNGGQIASSQTLNGLPADWHVHGTGDFDGDGRGDILWRNDNGAIAVWEMNGANIVGAQNVSPLSLDWNLGVHHYDFV
jgi:FG-GAP-like repeat/Bacterial pre-peptidase C-terminal domain